MSTDHFFVSQEECVLIIKSGRPLQTAYSASGAVWLTPDSETFEESKKLVLDFRYQKKQRNLQERWEAWFVKDEENPEDQTTFGVRGDGAIIILDEEGHFLIKDTGPGEDPTEPGRSVECVFRLFSSDETVVADAYIEPIFIAGLNDAIQDNYS